MTNEQIINKFLSQEAEKFQTVNSLTIEKDKLFSYATMIARFEKQTLLVTDHTYSVTTTKHVSLLKSNYSSIIYVSPNFLLVRISKKAQLKLLIDEINLKINELNKKKRKNTNIYKYLNNQHSDLVANCLDFIKLYNLKTDLNSKLDKIS